MSARVEADAKPSDAWLDGWHANRKLRAPVNPYDPLTQRHSHVQWQDGFDEREARGKAGTLKMQPTYDPRGEG